MRGFAQESIAVRTSNGHDVTLLEDLVYVSEKSEEIVVATGAASDGASTPGLLWSFLPPFGPYWRATVLHDFLYRCTTRSREECDGLLLEAMLSLGVHELTALTIFRGVRFGGQTAFDQDRAAQTSEHLSLVRSTPSPT